MISSINAEGSQEFSVLTILSIQSTSPNSKYYAHSSAVILWTRTELNFIETMRSSSSYIGYRPTVADPPESRVEVENSSELHSAFFACSLKLGAVVLPLSRSAAQRAAPTVLVKEKNSPATGTNSRRTAGTPKLSITIS